MDLGAEGCRAVCGQVLVCRLPVARARRWAGTCSQPFSLTRHLSEVFRAMGYDEVKSECVASLLDVIPGVGKSFKKCPLGATRKATSMCSRVRLC